MGRPRVRLLAAAGLVLVGLIAPGTPAGADPTTAVVGSPSGGDPYFPAAGNGGYQVRHYDLSLRYTPASRSLTGRARIEVTTRREDLRSFSLDLRDLTVSSVRVDGRPADFRQEGPELVVTPGHVLRARQRFTVDVRYGGTTGQPTDATGALYGWVSHPDGAFVANEPDGASTWFPVNDAPYDKATYAFRIRVPEGTVAVANGDLLGTRTRAGWTTSRWSAEEPMASYLAMAASGNYVLTASRTADGLPIVNAVDADLSPTDQAETAEVLARQPEMIAYFAGLFGPYPFGSFGAVVDDDEDADYALENQTRPIYSGPPSEGTVAHELAHQWYGDSVTPERWRDIWLNEGFATYAEWLWTEHRGGASVQEQFDTAYARPATSAFWQVEVGDPGAARLFDAAIYDRGAMALQALRTRVGDDAFFRVLRAWAQRHRYGVVSTDDLVRVAERVSGQPLDDLFTTWLHAPGKPSRP
ncbi:Peptidase family M1 [Friedmanniella luteola]|uniref:Aminopeptidase N n=1 Tax=Friedmanniella luteola TaxID=546871 RepID=A0A1H1WKR9_9ACTN|nr:M1 family metallopeptidase [Friedmanniella luteola]SDS97260.1 Peptidase family M1 [Friedmanniella luteola]